MCSILVSILLSFGNSNSYFLPYVFSWNCRKILILSQYMQNLSCHFALPKFIEQLGGDNVKDFETLSISLVSKLTMETWSAEGGNTSQTTHLG